MVLGGGSYWLHYLMGLVPGLVLLTAAACQRPLPGRRVLRAAYGVMAVSTVVALVCRGGAPDPAARAPGDRLARRARAARATPRSSRSARPNILQATGLRSPYPDLWSLPVRVHDPELRAPHRPARGRRPADLGRRRRQVPRLLGHRRLDRQPACSPITTICGPRTGDWTIYRADAGGE